MLPIKLLNKGKIREIYDLGDNLLILTTDKISAFDYVFKELIKDKGIYLNQISVFWFKYLKDIINNHFISSDIEKYPNELKPFLNEIFGRSMLVKKAKRINLECIVRGYLTGSGLKEYKTSGSVCGIKLKDGLENGSKLDEILFTPSTKAEIGEHDKNLTEKEAIDLVGKDTFLFLKEKSISLYKKAYFYALKRGIIIADTKFEFGFYNDEIILIDEVLTPDSSRFWDLKTYSIGKENESFDKQIIRNYLEKDISWNKKPPIPTLPESIINKTILKYKEVCELLIK